MSDTYTRILMYKPSSTKAQVGTKTTVVPLSSFVYSGGDNEHEIVEITSITLRTRINRYNKDGLGYEDWIGAVNVTGRNKYQATDSEQCSMGSSGEVSVSFNVVQSGAGIAFGDIVSVESKPEDGNVATYFGLRPLYLEITYTSEKYYLTIPNLECYRCDSSGNISLRGDHCKITARYSVGVTAPSSETIAASFTVRESSRSQVRKSGRSAVETGSGQFDTWIFSPSSGGSTFLPNQDYTITAVLVYGDESVTRTFVLKKARAPLSFNNYSVGVGQYAQGTENDERFDCSYPAHFHEPVYFESGVGGLPKIAYDNTNEFSVGSDRYVDFVINCSSAGFTAPPIVFASFVATSTDGDFGQCAASVLYGSATATGFTLRIFNGDSATHSMRVAWLAIGN